MNWAPSVFEQAHVVEWQVTPPSGRTCLYRATDTRLSDEDFEVAISLLADPSTLIAADDGHTRERFTSDLAIGGIDMDEVVDAATAQVALIDVEAGRGDIAEADLGYAVTAENPATLPGGGTDELFFHTYVHLVESGWIAALAERGIDAQFAFTPETTCVVDS